MWSLGPKALKSEPLAYDLLRILGIRNQPHVIGHSDSSADIQVGGYPCSQILPVPLCLRNLNSWESMTMCSYVKMCIYIVRFVNKRYVCKVEYTHAHVCIHIHISIHLHMYVGVYVGVYVSMYVGMHVCISALINRQMGR